MAPLPVFVATAIIPLFYPCLTAAFKQENGGCVIPSKWEGDWHQAAFREPIAVTSEAISSKGKCIEAMGDRAVFYDKSDGCYRCLVFHERHQNILQYKESPCVHKEPLQEMCARVTADAYLYSMIRIDAKAVNCPLPAPSVFTYSTGKGDCRYPMSSVERCSDPYRKLVRYQACPDVPGAESSEEELTCIATWKEGTSRYLMARLRTRHHAHGHHAERYRCYLLERDGASLKMAQSGDASCNGLFSTSEGARTYVFNPASTQPQCQFPPWLTKPGTKWTSLDYRSSIEISHSEHRSSSFMEESHWSSSLKDSSQAWYRRITRHIEESLPQRKEEPVASGRHQLLGTELRVWNLTLNPSSVPLSVIGSKHTDIRLACYEQYEDSTEADNGVVMYVAEIMDGCHNGYTCMELRKRTEFIMELSLGSPARRPEDACLPPYFTEGNVNSMTYVASSIPAIPCPNQGKHVVTWHHKDVNSDQPSVCSEQGGQSFDVGCRSSEMIDMKENCNVISQASEGFTCHSGWTDEYGEYLILTPTRRSSRGSKRYCALLDSRTPPPITLRDGRIRQEPTRVNWVASSMACPRADRPLNEGAFAFNTTVRGQCFKMNSAGSTLTTSLAIVISLALVWR